ncbi:MAG: arsenate reductase (glutaredoxin) [Wenzhouxiangellaceae bacterium]
METTVYHNRRCSKSRQTVEILERQGIEFNTVEYLKSPPDLQTLTAIAAKLDRPVADMVRADEPQWVALGLDLAQLDDAMILEALARCPKALQRPIVIHGSDARIGRPPEAVLDLFS